MRHEYHIRSAQIGDAGRIAEIAKLAYQQYLPLMNKAPAPMDANYTRHILEDAVFVMSIDDRLAGYAVIIRAEDDGYWLDNIAIDPEFAGRGFGRLFIAWIENWLSARTDTYQLYTNIVMTKNIDWYEKLGFQQTSQKIENGYQRVYFSKNLII